MFKINFVNKGNDNEKKVALTFDDGPNPYATAKIVNILNKYNIKGSFFVLGKWAKKFPELVKFASDAGHLIGNHTFSHGKGDFKKCDDILKNILSYNIFYIRPPFYDLNFCKEEFDFCNKLKIIKGDIDSRDYENITTEEVVKNVLDKISNGSIVDFHDGSENEDDLQRRALKTIAALPMVIEELKKRGFSIVPLNEMRLVTEMVNIDG